MKGQSDTGSATEPLVQYYGHIDASYQVSVQLAKQFQGRRFLEINPLETRIACGGQVCKRIGTE
jgi:hypothetical protein